MAIPKTLLSEIKRTDDYVWRALGERADLRITLKRSQEAIRCTLIDVFDDCVQVRPYDSHHMILIDRDEILMVAALNFDRAVQEIRRQNQEAEKARESS